MLVTERWCRCIWLVTALLVATADGRKHGYGWGNAKPQTSSMTDEPTPQPVPETFLRELVANFKANDDAESLMMPSSMSRSERRLVHIYAAQQGLGHKSITTGTNQRSLMLKKVRAILLASPAFLLASPAFLEHTTRRT